MTMLPKAGKASDIIKTPRAKARESRKGDRDLQFLISFAEGILTFVSPCLLPMIPIYVSYFAGGGQRTTAGTLKASLGFVTGFSAVFMAMGALAGTAGGFISGHSAAVNIVCGAAVVIFGLSYLGVFRLPIFRGVSGKTPRRLSGFFPAMLFGAVFSLGWTPCVGAFLGSALMLASQQGKTLTGVLMLACYSAGLGIPFVLSALLIDRLKGAFDFIKKNYRIINLVCGIFLVLTGVLMATGLLGKLSAAIA